MIYTVTLNPAIDKTIFVDELHSPGVNRATRTQIFPGGKGNNVAQVVHKYGYSCMATGILSGQTGRYIENMLAQAQIQCSFIYTSGETRTNTKIIDEKNEVITEINETGQNVSATDLQMIEHRFLSLIKVDDVVVFSGSLPPQAPEEIYRRWILAAKEKGAITILDSDQEGLKQGVCAGPHAIKPNIYEWKRFFDIKKKLSVADITHLAQALLDQGIEDILVSLGAEGALWISKTGIFYAEALKLNVRNTVGAGDAMTAMMAIGRVAGWDIKTTLRQAVACSGAAVISEHYEKMNMEMLIELSERVIIKEVFPSARGEN